MAPEKTSLLLRSTGGLESLKFVHTRHGAGDRAIGFDRRSGEFDLVLMSGEKIRDRLQAAGLIDAGGYAIVGYPKFDACSVPDGARPRLFANDRPTVLYNPHCSPRLSSWFDDGLKVLEAFYRSGKYNLIFAPHVMLFRKRIQISLKPLRVAWTGTVPERYLACPHILVDLGSERSTDMTYTEAADLYLGDVSSQIYEFLRRPRPCAFIDSHATDWQGDGNFRHWTCGKVLKSADDLIAAVDEAFASHADYVAAAAPPLRLQHRPARDAVVAARRGGDPGVRPADVPATGHGVRRRRPRGLRPTRGLSAGAALAGLRRLRQERADPEHDLAQVVVVLAAIGPRRIRLAEQSDLAGAGERIDPAADVDIAGDPSGGDQASRDGASEPSHRGAALGDMRERCDPERPAAAPALGDHRRRVAGDDQLVGEMQVGGIGIVQGATGREHEQLARCGPGALQEGHRLGRGARTRAHQQAAAARQRPGVGRAAMRATSSGLQPQAAGRPADDQRDPGPRQVGAAQPFAPAANRRPAAAAD